MFCLTGGWLFSFGLSFVRLPTISAIIDKGGTIWILGVMLGLRYAVQHRDIKWVGIWLAALTVFPASLLAIGFFGIGSASITIVLSALVISARSYWRVLAGISVAAVIGLSIFVNYFWIRQNIRNQVEIGASLEARVNSMVDVVKRFEWFDSTNRRHLFAVDQRLNQNYFVGVAAVRIKEGQVEYLYGRSLWEAALSLVPRIVWPEKTVFGGSPEIIAQMTGLRLSKTTSWGVGNVMEFQINFGIPGLIGGFFVLGWLLGALDRRAAAAEHCGDLSRVILFVLPSIALIVPEGSLVELTAGSAAALLVARGWEWGWKVVAQQRPTQHDRPMPPSRQEWIRSSWLDEGVRSTRETFEKPERSERLLVG